MVQNLLQDVIKNPTVRRTELAITYLNCRQKNGQTVQAFSDFLKNIEDRMDVVPFEDGNIKVDFYFAKLIDSLQTMAKCTQTPFHLLQLLLASCLAADPCCLIWLVARGR